MTNGGSSTDSPSPQATTVTPAWTDIETISFKFDKHYDSAFASIHELLNKTYCAPIRGLDALFEDGSSRTKIKPTVIEEIRGCIAETIQPLATATDNKTRIVGLLKKTPLSARLSDSEITQLRDEKDVEAVFQDVRKSERSKVVVHLDIDALRFDSGTNSFNPKRFDDIIERQSPSTTPTGSDSGEEKENEKKNVKPTKPVKNFFLLKQLEDDPNIEKGVIAVGTLVQCVHEARGLEPFKVGDSETKHFPYRFNDFSCSEDIITLRRTTQQKDYFEKDKENMNFYWKSTFNARIPMKVDVIKECFPFKIYEARIEMELTSGVCGCNNDIMVTPAMVFPKKQKTENFAIQTPKKKITEFHWYQDDHGDVRKMLDRMAQYDFVSPYPEVSFEYEPKDGASKKTSITFFLTGNNGIGKLVGTVLPLFLVAWLNTFNLFNDLWANEEIYATLLASIGNGVELTGTTLNTTATTKDDKENLKESYKRAEATELLNYSATLALAVVFLFGTIYDPRSFQSSLLSLDVFYVFCIFVALILSSVPEIFFGDEFYGFSVRIAGNVLFWTTFLIPICNFARVKYFYYRMRPRRKDRERFVKGESKKKEGKYNADKHPFQDYYIRPKNIEGSKVKMDKTVKEELIKCGYETEEDGKKIIISYNSRRQELEAQEQEMNFIPRAYLYMSECTKPRSRQPEPGLNYV